MRKQTGSSFDSLNSRVSSLKINPINCDNFYFFKIFYLKNIKFNIFRHFFNKLNFLMLKIK
jgi:hypothetical protein